MHGVIYLTYFLIDSDNVQFPWYVTYQLNKLCGEYTWVLQMSKVFSSSNSIIFQLFAC